LTVDFLARRLGLPATSQKDYLRIRSRIFRFSFVKYTNSASWNLQTRSYDIVNFGFFNIASLSRVTESRRPIVLEWDPTFLSIVAHGPCLAFDYQLYSTLSPTLRRLYLIANRDGWNQRDSGVYVADEFAMHQIGYGDSPQLRRDRLHKLRGLLADAEDLGLIRPSTAWGTYFKTASQGRYRDQQLLRWSRGPALRRKDERPRSVTDENLDDDPLYAQVRELRDEHGQPVDSRTYKRLVDQFGATRLQRHIAVILAQREHRPGSFQRSEVAAFIDRLQNDHAEPDWYQDLRRAEQLSLFADVTPNPLSQEMYGTPFRG
jgi:hypothetical protein